MSEVNNTAIVKEQYKNANNLNTRISIHDKYSTNKIGFGNWIFSNYSIKPDARILELGCGTGDMWKDHLHLLKKVSEIILTDFSDGMIKAAKETLGDAENLSYKVVDIQNIPYDDAAFDIVIANMMLYHIPQIDKGLAEVRRVLKNNGIFYCATYGEHGIIQYIAGLLKDFGVEERVNKNFTLQNGKIKLAPFFDTVNRLNYEDSLEVTDIDDIIDYVYSLSSMTNLNTVKRETLKRLLEAEKVNDTLHIPKEYGMFICQNHS